VLADQISAKFPDQLVIGNSNLVTVDREFPLGSPGTVFTIPFWKRATGFSDLQEGQAMTPNKVTATKETATVVRGGAAYKVLDTASLVSASDPVGELSTQVARRAAEYIDDKVVGQMELTPNTFDQTGSLKTNANKTMDKECILKALMKLGDNFYKALQGGWFICHSKVYQDLILTDAIQNQYQFGGNVAQTAILPMVNGLRIHVTDRVTTSALSGSSNLEYKSFIVAPESLALYYQRNVFVEYDRVVLEKADVIAADVNFAAHLYGYDDATDAVVAEDNKTIPVVMISSW